MRGRALVAIDSIIDSHGYMLALRGDAEAAGASFAFHAPPPARTARGRCTDARHRRIRPDVAVMPFADQRRRPQRTGAGARDRRHAARENSASLFRQGQLFPLVRARTPFTRLDLSRACRGRLGIHLTLDLAGQGRFGPDVERLDTKDGLAARLRRRRRTRRRNSTPQSAATGQRYLMAH